MDRYEVPFSISVENDYDLFIRIKGGSTDDFVTNRNDLI